MTWIAPDYDRPEPVAIAGEREMLDSWLEFHRGTLLIKCAGLSAEQLRTRSAEPSSMSLLGLVRHMTDVERSWFRRRIAGEDIPRLHSSVDDEDGDFDNVDIADAESDFAAFHAELAIVREVAARASLDDTFPHPYADGGLSVRWVLVHMIEEYARHNGHADLLRERVDGVTGE
jgi:uncharacterized damage-inducible protein DinB